jgi:hypothetical protein
MSIMKSTLALGIFVVSLCHPTKGELRGLKKGSKKASIGIDYDQSADKVGSWLWHLIVYKHSLVRFSHPLEVFVNSARN